MWLSSLGDEMRSGGRGVVDTSSTALGTPFPPISAFPAFLLLELCFFGVFMAVPGWDSYFFGTGLSFCFLAGVVVVVVFVISRPI